MMFMCAAEPLANLKADTSHRTSSFSVFFCLLILKFRRQNGKAAGRGEPRSRSGEVSPCGQVSVEPPFKIPESV